MAKKETPVAVSVTMQGIEHFGEYDMAEKDWEKVRVFKEVEE